jgi:hypothetical protein
MTFDGRHANGRFVPALCVHPDTSWTCSSPRQRRLRVCDAFIIDMAYAGECTAGSARRVDRGSRHHSLLFENDNVRVITTRIAPGEATALHTHCWPQVMIVDSFSDFIRRDDSGDVMADSRGGPLPQPGRAVSAPASAGRESRCSVAPRLAGLPGSTSAQAVEDREHPSPGDGRY